MDRRASYAEVGQAHSVVRYMLHRIDGPTDELRGRAHSVVRYIASMERRASYAENRRVAHSVVRYIALMERRASYAEIRHTQRGPERRASYAENPTHA